MRPDVRWLLGWWIAVVLVGGVVQVAVDEREPSVDVVQRDVVVLPEGQSKVTGTFTAVRGTDVVAPPLRTPIVLDKGTATLSNGAETIVWDGGRPFRLEGGGGLDLGPTTVAVSTEQVAWSLSGRVALLPGRYRLATPVAVGRQGLAQPRDGYAFTAGDGAALETTNTVARPLTDLHLEGPGSLVLIGRFEVTTRDGRRTTDRIEFGPGPFELDLRPDGSLTATLQD